MVKMSPALLPHSPWCCGSLQTGAVSVGVTCLVTLLLIFLWLGQILLEESWHSFVWLVILCLITFALVVANVCLLAGAVARRKDMIIPWLVLHLPLAVAIVVVCSITFWELGRLRPVAVASVALLIFFYIVVLAFCHELMFEEKQIKRTESDGDEEDKVTAASQKKEAEETLAAVAADDTFSALINRTPAAKQPRLPQPDEVIQVEESPLLLDDLKNSSKDNGNINLFERNSVEEVNPFLVPDELTDGRAVGTEASSSIELGSENAVSLSKSVDVGLQKKEDQQLLPDSTKDLPLPTPYGMCPPWQPRSHSHSALADIDASFTPYKGKPTGEKTPPKMRIFLPRDDVTSSSEEELEPEEGNKKSPLVLI